ncbi:hypothetical protein YPPY93_1651, partial [Yersinia pestis PY-93]
MNREATIPVILQAAG